MSATRDDKPAGGFTPEEERLHEAGFTAIRTGLEAGLPFDEACAGVESPDPDLRRIIVDDYLKVTIAQRHFEGGEGVEAVAAALKIPAERVETARREMLAEVAATSVAVFRREGGEIPDA